MQRLARTAAMALSGPKMIKNRPRCRGAARKSGRDWRVETAHKREYDGGGFWQCAVHGAVPNSRAAPCHTAVILAWELCGDSCPRAPE